MATLFCPICGQERTMRVHTEERERRGRREAKRAYNCEICDTLVKREDMP